jgi:3-hydroxyisobutyrate dehydrogenase-like beta-hydroxyacid dehydrogenase/mannose-6-phosphate isomerase-like protein (cupin superfamily)
VTSVAFIGLGAMGSRMAGRLLEAGHDLAVFNRTPEKAAQLLRGGAVMATSPAEAARDAEVVLTMVSDPAALRAVTDGCDGVAVGVANTATVIDMSTVGPREVVRLAAALPRGTGVLDAPVLGSIAEAEAGTLRLFVGGPADLAARWDPLLRALGTPLHVGGLGAGAAAKLVANSTLFGVLSVLGEAVALADGLGLTRDVTADVLATSPLAEQAKRREKTIAAEGVPPPRFALHLARKDAELVLAAAAERALDLRAASSTSRWLADAEAAGQGGADYTAVLSTIIAARAAPTLKRAVAPDSAPREVWGSGCEAWRLSEHPDLAIAEERMPAGTEEVWHTHRRARQFFFVLAGRATMRFEDREVEVVTGAGIEVAPGTPHAIANFAREELRFLVISSPTTAGDRRNIHEA